MSTAITTPSPAAARVDPSEHAPPLLRLTRIELRKMVDTRSGRWLLIAIAAIGLLVLAAIVFAGEAQDRTLHSMMQAVQLPLVLLLPVVGVLAATSEWSQRTVLTTFAAVPRRERVIVAKVLAGVALAVAAFAVSIAASVIVGLLTPAFGKGSIEWSVSADQLLQMALFDVLYVLLGVALGMALLNSALAIVLNFILPTVWTGIVNLIDFFRDVQPWLDTSATWSKLVDGNAAGDDWPKIATTALLWIALPLAIGTWRILRREVH